MIGQGVSIKKNKSSDTFEKSICYAISFVLLITYLFVLYKSVDYSGTSELYRAYYIDKKFSRYVNEDDMKTVYRPGVKLLYKTDGDIKNQGDGWSHIDDNATWSIGNDSYFAFYIEDTEREYELILEIYGENGYKNELYVNDNRETPIVIENGEAKVPVSKENLKAGINYFKIHTDDDVLLFSEIDKQSNDKRKLNLFVHSMILK